MGDTVFMRIIKGELPADIIYEDDQCLAFRDMNPQAPTHFLVVPRKPIASLQEMATEDEALIGHLHAIIAQLASQEGIAAGYRVVTNVGPSAGQSVFHLHFHVLGGRSMGWPPG